ncbi:MAG: hypothetical protein ACO2YV_03655, partial [Pseudomonadales bacterium]
EEAGLGEVEAGQNFVHHGVDAGVLQADGVEHAHGRFVNAVRGIADPGAFERVEGGVEEAGDDAADDAADDEEAPRS